MENETDISLDISENTFDFSNFNIPNTSVEINETVISLDVSEDTLDFSNVNILNVASIEIDETVVENGNIAELCADVTAIGLNADVIADWSIDVNDYHSSISIYGHSFIV